MKTDTSGTQLRASLFNSDVHIEDIGRTVHMYFLSANKMSRPNGEAKASIPHSTKVELFHSVREINVPNSLGQLWDAIDPK